MKAFISNDLLCGSAEKLNRKALLKNITQRPSLSTAVKLPRFLSSSTQLFCQGCCAICYCSGEEQKVLQRQQSVLVSKEAYCKVQLPKVVQGAQTTQSPIPHYSPMALPEKALRLKADGLFQRSSCAILTLLSCYWEPLFAGEALLVKGRGKVTSSLN